MRRRPLVTIRAFQDTTRECMQGRDLAIDYTDEFELGKPRKVDVFAGLGGVVVSTVRAPGGVVHEGKVRNDTESNDCPPRSPVSPGEPECSKHRGTLSAVIATTPLTRDEEDLTPLVRRVSISLKREDGGAQLQECMFSSVETAEAKVRPYIVRALWRPEESLLLPLGATTSDFAKLRKGKAIRRLIKLNGACNGVLISSGQAEGRAAARSAPRSNCTVTGKIFVSVRRVG